MKKLVLIPHERYEQFLVREAKESSVQQPESLENHSVEQETSTKPQEKRVEQVAEEEKEEKPSTSREVEINSTPPPPGEPEITLQTGEGASGKAKRRRERKSDSWRQKWKAYQSF